MSEHWIQKQLSHGTGAALYILEANHFLTDQTPLVEWCFQLLNGLHGQNTNWASHQDVLFLQAGGENLKNTHLQDIFSFLKTRAANLNQKYIIIDNVMSLGVLAQNKLLKVLEEPPVKATFFFLNPSRIKLLDTILSRAQRVKVVVPVQDSQLIPPSEILASELTEFQEAYKNNWNQIRLLIESFGHYLPLDAKASSELADIYQIYTQDVTYRNPSSYLTYKLYRFAQKWFITSH